MPMPAIAATRHQRDNSLPERVNAAGSQPVLLIATSTAKATANPGSSGGRGPAPADAPSCRRASSTAATITGSSIATRISLTKVAASPVSRDRLQPAPTTWATSWIVAPRNTPALRGSSASDCAIIG